ncbi:MAG: tyrosine-protein phosphatase [Firmicutes bacterium]|nr:tyrosine-protein phosphatase [Bacillota bacterium]
MRIDFDGMHNARDLGGMVTADGRRIKSGRLIRCGHLHDASERDCERLSEMVELIVDFRTDEEYTEQPDKAVQGAAHVHLPVIDTLTPGVTREERSYEEVIGEMLKDPEKAKAYMCGIYRSLVMSDFALKQYGRFVHYLLEPHEKAVLWHCTAGKDRASMATAIVLEALGVPRETIVADYLKTNEYLKEDIAFLTAFIKKRAKVAEDDMVADEALRYLYGADVSFIESFYAAIGERFGSVDAYLCDGLKLSEAEIVAFRNITLE